MATNRDRTAEVEAGSKEIIVKPTDYCFYFKKHPYTILWRKECWTCKFGDFGLETDHPTDLGVCRFCSKERKEL